MTKHLGWIGLIALSLLMLASELFAGIEVHGTHSGESTGRTVMASSVTTNTTSAVSVLPPGPKSFYGEVSGTGLVTQTQTIYGATTSTAANGVLLCTLTLSGTTRTQDACPVVTANFSYYYVVTTATTGTGATGNVYAMY